MSGQWSAQQWDGATRLARVLAMRGERQLRIEWSGGTHAFEARGTDLPREMLLRVPCVVRGQESGAAFRMTADGVTPWVEGSAG